MMNVVGHCEVADHHKLIALTDFFEDFEEQVAPFWSLPAKAGDDRYYR
jgi:hypothetical protein